MQNTAKKARQAHGGSSLPAPGSLMAPPTTGRSVGRTQNKVRGKKNSWVWDQYARQMKAGSAAASSDSASEGQQRQQQQGGEQMETSARAAAAGVQCMHASDPYEQLETVLDE
eukprot:1159803-Pelagomonas_calceolata.AAC.2